MYGPMSKTASSLFAKMRQESARHSQQTEDVGLKHRHELRLRDLFDRTRNAIAGVVHQNIHSPEPGERLRHCRVHLTGICYIE